MTLTERQFVNVETLHRCKICGSTYSDFDEAVECSISPVTGTVSLLEVTSNNYIFYLLNTERIDIIHELLESPRLQQVRETPIDLLDLKYPLGTMTNGVFSLYTICEVAMEGHVRGLNCVRLGYDCTLPSKLFKSGDSKLSWSEILSSVAVVDLKHTKDPNL